MENIVLYCKSYHRDVQRVKILLDSIEKYNKDKIKFYISVPQSDIKLFQSVLGTANYTIVSDEEIINQNMSQSWKNQQIVKVMFWKLGVSTNYIVLDSDSIFY